MLSVGLLFYELEMSFYFCSVLVPRLKFFRVSLIDTDKICGRGSRLTAKVTFLSAYPFPGLVAYSVFS